MAHGDFTGNQKAKLAQQYAEEQALAAKHMTTITGIVEDAAGLNQVIDIIPGYNTFEEYKLGKEVEKASLKAAIRRHKIKAFEDAGLPVPKELTQEVSDEDVVEVTEVDEESEFDPMTFRCTDTVEAVSLGSGPDSIFDLKANQVYRAPRWVVKHLAEKDLVQRY